VRAAPGAAQAAQDLPLRLKADLPNFMQPSAIHWRAAMPIGPNGKIDRNGLAQELAAQQEAAQ
jgi:acyl-coenzyme A synthetase/AMP-(fatty) acid ligase